MLEQPTERVAADARATSPREYTAAGRGFDLRRAAGGWRLYTRPEYAPYVERFVLDGQSGAADPGGAGDARRGRLQAAGDPVADLGHPRCQLRRRDPTLVTRGLIEECGTEPDSGAFLYRTTTLFLEKLGLNSVDELPPLAPFLPDDVDEIADAQR